MSEQVYNVNTWSFGYELELSDVSRALVIPPHLGTWDYSERDIVNTQGDYRGVAADPLGTCPSVGGEINVMPSRSIEGLVQNVKDIVEFFRENGDNPAIGPSAHGHVHVHVPGLRNDVRALRCLTGYVRDNQADFVRLGGRYEKREDMDAKAVMYMKLDGGRLMPDWLCGNIIGKAETFDDFIRLHCCGRDGVSRGRPFRHAINMYCLKHTDTIEFRSFRGTLDMGHLEDSVRASMEFIWQGLTAGTPFRECAEACQWQFAPMTWDRELWDGLQRTKWPEGRGKKARKFVELG